MLCIPTLCSRAKIGTVIVLSESVKVAEAPTEGYWFQSVGHRAYESARRGMNLIADSLNHSV